MKSIIQFVANDGSDLLIEISNTTNSEAFRGANNGNRGIIENTKESFYKALKPLKEVSNSIIDCIKEISTSPDEVEVELGFKFSSNASIILTSLDSEAHFKITFKWIKEKNE